jgi:hypothetical protein
MHDPKYDLFVDLLTEETRKKFVETLIQHEILYFKSLYTNYLKISETNARHHLNQLLTNEIVQKVKQKGTKAIFLQITPQFFERARHYFNIESPTAYFGMVGKKDPGQQLKNALERFDTNNRVIKALFVFSTHENIDTLQEDDHWQMIHNEMSEAQLLPIPPFDFDTTYQLMKKTIEDEIPKFSLITDVTGSTKIHTLALYSLAQEFGLVRVYLPEDESNRIINLP